jgi:tungstate transport system substrate-binding protein
MVNLQAVHQLWPVGIGMQTSILAFAPLELENTVMVLISASKAFALVALLALGSTPLSAAEKFIVVASTTSTVNSGLFGNILPQFTKDTGIEVRVVGVGTGQAIRVAERGDADVLFVHHKKSELAFVDKGFGVARLDVMYNDFVVVGPRLDPAAAAQAKSAADVYQRIAAAKAAFVSRGDDSGTHKKSLEIWKQAAIDVKKFSGKWYRESGSGMGATLNIAVSMNGYTLTDRSSWQAFKNKGALALLFGGDPGLRNQYGIILVNPERHNHVKAGLAFTFIDWLLSAPGQTAINAYRLGGKQTFFANALGTAKIN